MKFSAKIMVVMCLLVITGVCGYLLRPNANASAASVTYVLTNSGIVFGNDPSPLQIVQAVNGKIALPIGSAFVGADNLLDSLQVRLRNSSPQEIKFARLRVDVFDPQTGKITATAAGLTLDSGLAIGKEQTGKVTSLSSESLRRSVLNSGQNFQKVLVQVDFVVMSNGTSWKYGLLHRQGPKDPNSWTPIGKDKQQTSLYFPLIDNAKPTVEKVSLRSSQQPICKVFGGYHLNRSQDCSACAVYNENWYDDICNGFAEAGDIPWYCPDGTICYKVGYIGYVPNCYRSPSCP